IGAKRQRRMAPRPNKAGDRRRAKGRDPIEARRFDGLVETRLGDHAAIADQHHTLKCETSFDLADLALERGGIADIALEDLDRHRASLGGAKKPKHDLQLAFAGRRASAFSMRSCSSMSQSRAS